MRRGAQPLVNVRIAVLAAVVLGLTAQAEQPAANSLEKATRDLRALSTEKTPESLRKNTGIGSASLPSLVVPAPAATPAAPPPNGPPSETWLQDALDATNAERSGSRRTNADAASNRGALREEKMSRAADPFDRYLTQWLSPRDLEVLRPETKSEAPQLSQSFFEQSVSISEKVDPLALPGTLPPAPPGMGPAARNPYLQDLDPVTPPPAMYQTLPPGSPAVENGAPRRAAPEAFTPVPIETAGSTRVAPMPTPAAKEAVSPPPTAPVIDDRKYFPQLRRF